MEDTILDRFLDDVGTFGLDLDDTPPPVPDGPGAVAWVLARVRQVLDAAETADDLDVDTVTVEAAAGDRPAGLQEAWPWPQVPLILDSGPGPLPDPLPPGMCRLWVRMVRTPLRPGPGGGRPMSRMADLTFVHGLVPNAEQEERLRLLPDLDLLWRTVDPLPLDAALEKLDPSA